MASETPTRSPDGPPLAQGRQARVTRARHTTSGEGVDATQRCNALACDMRISCFSFWDLLLFVYPAVGVSTCCLAGLGNKQPELRRLADVALITHRRRKPGTRALAGGPREQIQVVL